MERHQFVTVDCLWLTNVLTFSSGVEYYRCFLSRYGATWSASVWLPGWGQHQYHHHTQRSVPSVFRAVQLLHCFNDWCQLASCLIYAWVLPAHPYSTQLWIVWMRSFIEPDLFECTVRQYHFDLSYQPAMEIRVWIRVRRYSCTILAFFTE